MASLIEKVSVEMENISAVLEELKKIKDKPDKTLVELVGIIKDKHNVCFHINWNNKRNIAFILIWVQCKD